MTSNLIKALTRLSKFTSISRNLSVVVNTEVTTSHNAKWICNDNSLISGSMLAFWICVEGLWRSYWCCVVDGAGKGSVVWVANFIRYGEREVGWRVSGSASKKVSGSGSGGEDEPGTPRISFRRSRSVHGPMLKLSVVAEIADRHKKTPEQEGSLSDPPANTDAITPKAAQSTTNLESGGSKGAILKAALDE